MTPLQILMIHWDSGRDVSEMRRLHVRDCVVSGRVFRDMKDRELS